MVSSWGRMPARALAVALASSVLVQGPATTPAAHFPSVSGDNLSKATLHLPADFAGANGNLILIAFEREQQKDVDTWAVRAAVLEKSQPGFRFYDLPILPRRDIFYRWWLNTAMRSGVSEDAARARTIPLYVGKEDFRKSLQIPSERTITALLLNKQGDVVWRTEGPWSDDKQKQLLSSLEHH